MPCHSNMACGIVIKAKRTHCSPSYSLSWLCMGVYVFVIARIHTFEYSLSITNDDDDDDVYWGKKGDMLSAAVVQYNMKELVLLFLFPCTVLHSLFSCN